jgi:hypothetical protein
MLGHTAMVEMLISKTKAWEDDRGIPFMFDGVHLLSIGLFLPSSIIFGNRLLLD